ncbi:AbrB/MazE/SpoVT family DNA-binding domain-containing protein [Ornithinimicrobium faecis]|uniref:AbrB/MazE/SpoVT family DNA-binding domain-containing protein n=1 Tax=Ornithinimicrobium faecis TaxID=2934158 RepID=UPI002117DA40|nr:AbrB/MazE/SpoVT family DNA-binding domain-containing protein [Ornithinimicrobium sp. HY1745]
MSSATMTSKGQITVPKVVRDDLGLVPGAKVLFVKLGDGHYRLVARTGEVSDLAGMLHREGQQPLSLTDMDEGMAAAAAESGHAGTARARADE